MGITSQLAASRLIQPGVCTSSTRPASPFEGQYIYETDTNCTLVYDGSAWVVTVDADNPPGLVLVKSQTIGTGVGAVSVTNCFNSSFDNYFVSVAGTVCSGAGNAATIVMMNGSTINSTSWYGNTFYIGTGAGGSLTNASFSNAAFGEIGSITNTTGGNSFVFDVQAPYRSEYTRVQFNSADAVYVRMGWFVHELANSYDGFQLSTYGVTLTGGTISVYGYRKAV